MKNNSETLHLGGLERIQDWCTFGLGLGLIKVKSDSKAQIILKPTCETYCPTSHV